MSETEMYARSVAAGADGKIYVGVGMVKPDVVVYDPATRRHRSILPPQYQSFSGAPSVWTGADGHVYASCPGATLRVDGPTVTETKTPIGSPPRRLRDGRIVTAADRGAFSVHDPKSGKTAERRFQYEAAGDPLFTVGVGPHGCIYGSTAMPLEVFRYDPRAGRSEVLGPMSGGEVYSMIEHEGKLYLCFYGGSVMNLYDPAKPFWRWGSTADCNPISFGSVGDGHLRPRAMIDGPDGMIYIGSHPPYGQLGGAMAIWDPRKNRTIENYRHLVKNQSIVSLAYEPQSGLVFGGSGNFGGGGTQASEKEALFFAFDPRKKRKVFETALVPGASQYPAMCAAEGKLFVAVGDQLVVFDPGRMKPVRTAPLPGAQIEISLGRHGSGLLYGLTAGAIYSVDPRTFEVRVLAKAPVGISCGFALTADAVYFGSGVHLWRYRLQADAGGLSAAALNEILLQSHGAILRIAPAVAANWSGVFRLRAEGGFLVYTDNAEKTDWQHASTIDARWDWQPAGKNPKNQQGIRFEGTEGWLFVARDKLDAEPKSLLQENIKANEIRLPVSTLHERNFLDCVKSRARTIAPIEVAVRSDTLCHLAHIAARLGRKLKWDPECELFVGDQEANRLLGIAHREPWTL
jgi:hypothetical protein